MTSLGLERPGSTVNVAGAGAPAQVPVIYMDRHMLPTLGLQPMLGSNFTAQEDRPNGPPVVILGYGFWQRSYGGDTHVIGRSLQVEGVPHTIVGVLPPGFNTVLGPGDVMLPTALLVAATTTTTTAPRDRAAGARCRHRRGVGADRCARAHDVPRHDHGRQLEEAAFRRRNLAASINRRRNRYC